MIQDILKHMLKQFNFMDFNKINFILSIKYSDFP